MKKVYLIGGTMGVGKTAVCEELERLLDKSVYLDGDSCWNPDPLYITEESKKEVLKVIVERLNKHIEDPSLKNIIFGWVMHEQYIIDGIVNNLIIKDCELINVSLLVSEYALKERLEKDIKEGKRTKDIIEKSISRIPFYNTLNTIKINTDNKSVADIAKEIVDNKQDEFIIYKHTTPGGLSYIGQTKMKDYNERFVNGLGYIYEKSHNNAGSIFIFAIAYYGWDNISHEILETNIKTITDANNKETEYIDKYDSYFLGYNMNRGFGNKESANSENRCFPESRRLMFILYNFRKLYNEITYKSAKIERYFKNGKKRKKPIVLEPERKNSIDERIKKLSKPLKCMQNKQNPDDFIVESYNLKNGKIENAIQHE